MINLPLTRRHQPWRDIMGDLITYFLWGKTDIVGSLSEIFCAIFAGLIDVDWLSSNSPNIPEYSWLGTGTTGSGSVPRIRLSDFRCRNISKRDRKSTRLNSSHVEIS